MPISTKISEAVLLLLSDGKWHTRKEINGYVHFRHPSLHNHYSANYLSSLLSRMKKKGLVCGCPNSGYKTAPGEIVPISDEERIMLEFDKIAIQIDGMLVHPSYEMNDEEYKKAKLLHDIRDIIAAHRA